jgi:hypothetical protein
MQFIGGSSKIFTQEKPLMDALSSRSALRAFSRVRLGLLFAAVFFLFWQTSREHSIASSWSPTLLVNSEAFQVIDVGDGASSVEMRFGATQSLSLLPSGVFQFNRSLSVVGGLSGRYLIVDGNASISGNLLVKRSSVSFGEISGATLTISGQSNFSGAVTVIGPFTTKRILSGGQLFVGNSAISLFTPSFAQL